MKFEGILYEPKWLIKKTNKQIRNPHHLAVLVLTRLGQITSSISISMLSF